MHQSGILIEGVNIEYTIFHDKRGASWFCQHDGEYSVNYGSGDELLRAIADGVVSWLIKAGEN